MRRWNNCLQQSSAIQPRVLPLLLWPLMAGAAPVNQLLRSNLPLRSIRLLLAAMTSTRAAPMKNGLLGRPDSAPHAASTGDALEDEAVEPLRDGRIAHYHPSDFNNGAGLAPHVVTCDPKSVIILDGAYSGRPELAEIVDIAVLIELPDGLRRSRLLAREGVAFMNRWHPIWDLAEDYYFAHVCPPSRYDFVFAIFA